MFEWGGICKTMQEPPNDVSALSNIRQSLPISVIKVISGLGLFAIFVNNMWIEGSWWVETKDDYTYIIIMIDASEFKFLAKFRPSLNMYWQCID